MLPTKEFNKIKRALDAGTLQIRFLTDQEYEEAERRFQAAKENQINSKAEKPEILICQKARR